MFKQYGHKLIVNGRVGRDDYITTPELPEDELTKLTSDIAIIRKSGSMIYGNTDNEFPEFDLTKIPAFASGDQYSILVVYISASFYSICCTI